MLSSDLCIFVYTFISSAQNISLMNPYLCFKTQLKWFPQWSLPWYPQRLLLFSFPSLHVVYFSFVITKIILQCREGGNRTTHSPNGLDSWQGKLTCTYLHVCTAPYPQGTRKNTLKGFWLLGLPSSSFKSFNEEVGFGSLSYHSSLNSPSLVCLSWSET